MISDTHMPRGGRRLPERCVGLIYAAEVVLHAGDFTAASVLEEVEAIGPPVLAVHGNVDEPGLRERLPASRVAEAGDARIAMVHDAGPRAGRLARLRARFPDAAAVIFGHSHLPLHEMSDDDGFQIFNPGSPTERRRAPEHTMGLARVEGGRLNFELVSLGSRR